MVLGSIIDGKKIAEVLRRELQQTIRAQKAAGQPGLAVVLVGEDPASLAYVTMKENACAEMGIRSFDHRLPMATSEADLLALIGKLNNDPLVNGILVQMPLPRQIDENRVIAAIDPRKDVDAFHPVNVGRMLIGLDTFLPCTPHGVLKLLLTTGVKLAGAHVVIVGRSNIVGKPLAAMLIQKGVDATVTVCHSRTRDLASYTRQGDVLVAAMGRPGAITAEMVKEGAVVIDVGINRVDDASAPRGYRLVGDVDFAGVQPKVAAITPVPGGVGPMTITMLLHNTVKAWQNAGR